ncbi:hypothetical protein PsorP6_010479 [Peronosclerospora sorghi]|uniref:Uncharacterized protein n=1 Tax=Peronosclerospora sorghi TaxID=230839 RepID=A0ACC0VUF6_9STRA|nr:hypothetical protein PsorP6_010479 [Peronosclerospora sorghi]
MAIFESTVIAERIEGNTVKSGGANDNNGEEERKSDKTRSGYYSTLNDQSCEVDDDMIFALTPVPWPRPLSTYLELRPPLADLCSNVETWQRKIHLLIVHAVVLWATRSRPKRCTRSCHLVTIFR